MPVLDAERLKYDVLTLWGSAGSGKSRWIVQRFVLKMMTKEARRYVCIRKVANTLRGSTYQEFLDVIYSWNVGFQFHCTTNPMKITNTVTGTVMIFMGLDSREKIKSLASSDEIFIEEITELELLDFLQVLTRIRGIGKDGDRKLVWAAFNPVDEEHWVKRVLIDRKNDEKALQSLKIFEKHTTWRNNKFVGSDYEAKLNLVGEFDQNYYNVYSLGLWGSIKPESPFFYRFNDTKNIHQYRERHGEYPTYNANLAVYLSFDFNKRNSCVVSQKDFEKGYFVYLEEIHQPVGFDLVDVVNRIVDTYGQNVYWVTGDPAGNQASALSSKNRTAYQTIMLAFRERGLGDYLNMSHVPQSILTYENSKVYCASLLTREEIYFHPDMKETLKDLRTMRQSADGGLDKAHCEKNDYGHLGDCVRYDMAFHFYERFRSYQISMKNRNLEALKFKNVNI